MPARWYPVHDLAVLSSKNQLSRRHVLDVADLADEPLLLLHRSFGSREWFDSACHSAHIRPRVRLESAAPHTLIALTEVGYGVAVVPSTVLVPRGVRGLAVGPAPGRDREMVDHRLGPPAIVAGVRRVVADELVVYCRRDYPGRNLIRRAPPLPRPTPSIR